MLHVLSIPLTAFSCTVMMVCTSSFGVDLMLDQFGLSTTEVSDMSSKLMIQPIPFQIIMLIIGGFMYDGLGKKITIFTSMLTISMA
jgi:hypothetical protein